MSSDPLKEHLSSALGPIKDSERAPDAAALPGEYSRPRLEGRRVSGPNRVWVSTGRTVGERGRVDWPSSKKSSTPAGSSSAGTNAESAGALPADSGGRTPTGHGGAAASELASDAAADALAGIRGEEAEEAKAALADPEVMKYLAPHIDGLSKDLEVLGEPESSRQAMGTWLAAFTEGKAPAAGDHPFAGITKWRQAFSPQEFQYVESAATALAAAGVTEPAFDAMVRRFGDIRAARQRGPFAHAFLGAMRRRSK